MAQVRPDQLARMTVRWTPRDILRGLISLAVLSLLVLLSVVLGHGLLRDKGESAGAVLALSAGVTLEVLMLVIVWRLTVRKYRVPWQALGFRRWASSSAIVTAGVVTVVGLGIVALYGAIVQRLGLDILKSPPLPEFFSRVGVPWALGLVLVLGLAPIAEETFFRGFVFGGLAVRYGFRWGAGISALLFSLSHVELGSLIPAFVLGLLLAWLYTTTRSLWSCILAHFLYNGVILAIAL